MVEQLKNKETANKENENDVKEKKVRPQDLTRLYEIILQNLTELQQLPGLEDDLKYQQEVEIKVKIFKAFRQVIFS